MHWIFTRLTFNRCDDFKNVEKLWDELTRVTTRQYISACECFNAWKEQTFEFHCSRSTQRNYLIVKKANSNHLMMLFGSNKYNLSYHKLPDSVTKLPWQQGYCLCSLYFVTFIVYKRVHKAKVSDKLAMFTQMRYRNQKVSDSHSIFQWNRIMHAANVSHSS